MTGNLSRAQTLDVLCTGSRDYDVARLYECQLFDSFDGSILGYSSEIWGFGKYMEIERIHLKSLKRILGVKVNTSSSSVYGELGRYPLYISRYMRIIKYWCKVSNSDTIIVKSV